MSRKNNLSISEILLQIFMFFVIFSRMGEISDVCFDVTTSHDSMLAGIMWNKFYC